MYTLTGTIWQRTDFFFYLDSTRLLKVLICSIIFLQYDKDSFLRGFNLIFFRERKDITWCSWARLSISAGVVSDIIEIQPVSFFTQSFQLPSAFLK